jgi:predicted TIM-barrel fold metal-dependent hydrolase
MTSELPIIDCHQHFYDSTALRYGVFSESSAGFTALVGDYAALPRVYRPEDYARDIADLNVVGSVWAEFISSDPLDEVRWAAALARDIGRPTSLIALVDFADSHWIADWTHIRQSGILASRCCVSLSGPTCLRQRGLVCEIEVFASQLRDLADVAAAYSDLQFVLPLMGWPIGVTEEGHRAGSAISRRSPFARTSC